MSSYCFTFDDTETRSEVEGRAEALEVRNRGCCGTGSISGSVACQTGLNSRQQVSSPPRPSIVINIASGKTVASTHPIFGIASVR
jgi:hypothetical protein